MKEVPNIFIQELAKDLGLGFDTSYLEKKATELKSATAGKFTPAPPAGNAQEPKVTGNQENAAAASNAASYHKADAVYDDGPSSPAANTGLPSNIGNKWRPPTTLTDSRLVDTPETNLNEDPLHDRIDKLEEALATIVEAMRRQLEEAKKPSAGLTSKKKKKVVKKARKGGDIGKKGKNFAKVAAKAGGGEKGEKIAAAAMWKNMKR